MLAVYMASVLDEFSSMPINVACDKCSQKFAAPDKLAGKAVRCPKCSNPIRIPARGGGPAQQTAQQPAPQQQSAMDDLFDEAGIESTAPGGIRCPSCFVPMQPSAVMCVSCGFNTQTGEKTEGFAQVGFEDDNAMFRDAQKEIKEDAEAAKKSVDPVPWYYYVALLLVMGFVAVFFSIAWKKMLDSTVSAGQKKDYIFEVITLLFLVSVPSVLLFVTHWASATYAFVEDNVNKGFMCLFIPLFDVIYAIQHWSVKGMKSTVIMWFIGFIWGTVVAILYFATDTLGWPTLPEGSSLSQ